MLIKQGKSEDKKRVKLTERAHTVQQKEQHFRILEHLER